MRVCAPAKINLTLEVTGVEPNGYHTLDTIFSWLDLEDTLEFKVSHKSDLQILAEGVSVDSVFCDESNLVLKALRSLEAAVGRELPTKIRLTKRIPTGGGLGGGSADAAATLIGINSLHSLGLDRVRLLDLARPLGADVAFGLVGGLARGTGYGDRLEPMVSSFTNRDQRLVLVMPDFGCSTPEVFCLWDSEPSHKAAGASQRFSEAKDLESQLAAIANDLEEPAFRLRPELPVLKQKMIRAGLHGVCLSGSGSTLFGFLEDDAVWRRLEKEFSTLGVTMVSTRLREGTRFEFVS